MAPPHRPHPNCYWLSPLILAGEYPGAKAAPAAKQKLHDCFAAGVRHFIDLTESRDGLAPYEPMLAELPAPVGYERHGLKDMGLPESPHDTARILDRLDALAAAGTPTYLHCWGGIGRTGLVAGCWLVRHGRTGEAALAELAGHWASVEKRVRFPESPQTSAQRRYVVEWAAIDPHLRGR